MGRTRPKYDRLGPFRVVRPLAEDEPRPIYLAREDDAPGSSNDVVLEIASRGAGTAALDFKELAREAAACAKLDHPGIVRTLRSIEKGDAFAVASENAVGLTLAEIASSKDAEKQRSLDDEASFHIGTSILDALAHAHASVDEHGARAPIVHGWVNPGRVLIGADGSVKLGGFGFGAAPASVDAKAPGYTAPEQVAGQKPTPKSDVYVAGLILWELLSGQRATTKPEPLASLRRDLPRELVAAIDAAITESPDKRAITSAELAAWIRKVVQFTQAKKELGARVKAALPAPLPDEAPPVVPSVAPAPRPVKAALANRTLIGVAPPSRALSKVPPPPARAPASPMPPEKPLPADVPLSIGVPLPIDMAAIAPPPAAVSVPPPLVDALVTSTPAMAVPTLAAAPEDLDIPFRPSLVDRLRAPTRWSRNHLIAAWISLAWVTFLVAMLVVVTKSLSGGSSAHAAGDPGKSPAGGMTLPTASSVSPPAPREVSPPEVSPPEVAPAAPSPAPEEALPANASDLAGSTPPKGYGFVTVHSGARYANVYVMFAKYGHVEERIAVPCGLRFISVGVPARGRREPVWLAPGKKLTIPCGESIELTMNPRRLR